MFDEPQLASLCLENIDKNTGDALAAEGFTDIDLGNWHPYSLRIYHFSKDLIVTYLNSDLLLTDLSFRHIGGSVGERHSWGEGGAFVWSCSALG